MAPCAPHPPEQAPTHRTLDPAVTEMLTDPTLTGMSRADFAHLVAVSEPYWDALAEAAFQRHFHRPPQKSTPTVIYGQAPSAPQYIRATPGEFVPSFGIPVSSTTRASGSINLAAHPVNRALTSVWSQVEVVTNCWSCW